MKSVEVDDRTALVLGQYCWWLAQQVGEGRPFSVPGFDRPVTPAHFGVEGSDELQKRLMQYATTLIGAEPPNNEMEAVT